MNAQSDRIVELRVRGMRTLADVRLKLDGLTVLIGQNGTGKSTLIEALELIRKFGASRDLEFALAQHYGLDALLRAGQDQMTLGVSIEGAGPRIDYELSVGWRRPGQAGVLSEALDYHVQPGASAPLHVIRRTTSRTLVYMPALAGERARLVEPDDAAEPGQLELHGSGTHPAIIRMRRALNELAIHTPFDVRALWLERELATRSSMRYPVEIAPADRLERSGRNLANAMHALLQGNSEQREPLLGLLRLGLGGDLIDVATPAVQTGFIQLVFRFDRRPELRLPLSQLSDGQLTFLGFVALTALHHRGLLAFDEPEVHLHPSLIGRIVDLLEQSAQRAPVLLTTHSDRLLDFLESPAESIVLCELDATGATRLLRPRQAELSSWLERYRFGELRAAGYAGLVFAES